MSRVLIVTGGSRGLGAATCIGAAEAGYEAICVNYVGNKARANEVVAACEKAGAKAIAAQADVTKEADIVRMFETVDKELGTVTHLVNSAGIVGPYARVDELDNWSALEELWTLNITATLVCSREAIKRMSTKHGGKGGAIVHLSSAASHLGGAGVNVPYAASKGAMITMTKSLARVLGPEVRINAVCPGFIQGEWLRQGMGPEVYDRTQAFLEGATPLKRTATADTVAEAIIMLITSASLVTGETLLLDGGHHLL